MILTEPELIIWLGRELIVKAVESKIARIHPPQNGTKFLISEIDSVIPGLDIVPNCRKNL